ncbi:MAG: glycosyltransferase [Streptococcaceae bacterium]|jgi:glycosyltransferase involved in cell wall biosynthesis|nr:glycosyltransferase [Streptococcaceae bacterium]
MKKTILFLSPTATLDNGAEISIFNLMKLLKQRGHEVINVAPDFSHAARFSYIAAFEEIGVKTYLLPSIKWWWADAPGRKVDENELAFNHRAHVERIRQLILENRVDVIVSNTVNVSQGSVSAAIENIPHIWLIHEFPEDEFEYYLDKIDYIDQYSTEIFSVQGNLQQALTHYFPTRQIKTFVPFSELKVNGLRSGEKTRLVCIGRLSPRKNQLELIRAFHKLNRPDLELILIGEIEEDYKPLLEKYIKDYQVKNVTFMGNMKDPWSAVTNKDIFVTSSGKETFGLVVIEALLNGVPVIMSDNPGYETVYDIFHLGKIYHLGNVQQLDEQILATMENFEAEKAASLAAAPAVREKYQVENAYAELVAELESEELAAKPNPVAAIGDLLSLNGYKGYVKRSTMIKSKIYDSLHINPAKVKNLLRPAYHAYRDPKKALKRLTWYLKRPIFLARKALYHKMRDRSRGKPITSGKPRRYLIYVIYEDQPRVQQYKILFLKALAEMADKVMIVVNGQLTPEDQALLSKYGRLEMRENEGYDAAAFRYGLLMAGKSELAGFDELVMVNDTNVGPFIDLSKVFHKMDAEPLDFWGVSYGEEQGDPLKINPYGMIPKHLQSYFLVIKKNLLNYDGFWSYWENMPDTNSRERAILLHETVFTQKFEDLGFRHDAVTHNNYDSAIYIHPLEMILEGVPLVKYTAFMNDTDEKYEWQGIDRASEIPELLNYIRTQTDYPMSVIDEVFDVQKKKQEQRYILIIDGVENKIPQCTRYRVLNKAEQLRSLGFSVKTVNQSEFKLPDAEFASHIIIYRAEYNVVFKELLRLARKYGKPVYYDIDDLVIDPVYTNQLAYTQALSPQEKKNYDATVLGYGKLLKACDAAITTTFTLQKELQHYQKRVLLNRNLASAELVDLSAKVMKDDDVSSDLVNIGYFSGSITHNENFELIKPAILEVLKKYPQVRLNLVGHLDIPKELSAYSRQLISHDYVDWQELPGLLAKMDINLAPLVDSIFNQAKSEIKWIEAALVKVPTIASKIGAFEEMVEDGKTGLLARDDDWQLKLEQLIRSAELRQELAENAYQKVIKDCVTIGHVDSLSQVLGEDVSQEEQK